MSGAAGLAAARRRRGGSQQASSQSRVQQPPPVPQQQQRQQPQNIQNSQVHTEPTSPMDTLHQHHLKIDEHVTVIEAIRKNIDEMNKKEELMSQQYEERLVKDRNETLEFVKGNMLEPLENDLQSILNGYQLKIDMLSSTMNTQQNYIMELNTTLLGIVKQLTKLLAIKESEGNITFNTASKENVDFTPSDIAGTDNMDTVEGTDYFAGKAPLPYDQDNTPVATFGDDLKGYEGTDSMDIVSDEVATSKQGEPLTPTVIVGEASTSTKEPGSQVNDINDTDTSQDKIDSSSEHPEVDLSVE